MDHARNYLNRPNLNGKYSLIQLDVFLDVTIPFHLTTHEFDQRIKAVMQPNGIYMMTLVESGTNGKFLRAHIQTLRQSFKTVLLYEPEDLLNSSTRATFVVVATNRPMSQPPTSEWKLVSESELEAYPAKEPPLILTDNYAPVDNLLLPVVDRELDGSGNK